MLTTATLRASFWSLRQSRLVRISPTKKAWCSDGTFHFWDKDAKNRLKGYPNVGGSISSTTFNKTGSIFAYAISYDWAKGYQANTTNYPTKVMLHPVQADECKPRPSTKKR